MNNPTIDGVLVPRDLIARATNPVGDPNERFNAVQELRALFHAPAVERQHALTVWEGAMPESNGKSNFTAILKRKEGGSFLDEMTNGFTIARSEYPDRVRYEADCVRWLIGELAEEPFILDYDANAHSGYTTPPAPVAVRMTDEQIAKTIEGFGCVNEWNDTVSFTEDQAVKGCRAVLDATAALNKPTN